jgi:hypothetical protein
MRFIPVSSGARLTILLLLMIPSVLIASRREANVGAAPLAPASFQTADPRFGMNGILPDFYTKVHGIRSFPWAATAAQQGARLNRFSFDWQSVEPQQGTFNFSGPAAYIASDQAHNLATIATLEHTPYWATSAVTDNPTAQVPNGLNLPWNDTRNTWGYFVYQSAAHFKGQVAYWEVWNEPDLQNGASWSGSRATFYLLLKVAYEAVKAADPNAQVLIGSLNYNPTWLNDVFTADAADPTSAANQGYFDGLGLHSYGRSIGIYNMAVQAHQVLDHFGYTGKVLIATELGVAVDDDPAVPAKGLIATSAEASSYIIEAFAAALAGGVDRMLLYRASDVGEPSYYGLLKYSGVARSTAIAYELATQYFTNVVSARLIQSNPVTRVLLNEGSQQVTVLWNNSPQPATVSFYEQSANGGTLIDATGTPSQAQRDSNGYYTITLPGATDNHGANSSDFIIGGGPLILVERGPFVPTQTATATSTIMATLTPTLSSTPTPLNNGPTATQTPTATASATASPTSTPSFPPNSPRTYWPAGEGDSQFHESLSVANPFSTTTHLRLSALGQSGPLTTSDLPAAPYAITNIDLGLWNLPAKPYALSLLADQSVAAADILQYKGGAGVESGLSSPATHWYFPGTAATVPITQEITISNPRADPAGITLSEIGGSGALGTITGHVNGLSRQTFIVASKGRTPNLGIVLTADQPVAADYTAFLPGGNPITTVPGIRDLSHVWYSAEGYESQGWSDHLVVLNPDPRNTARLTITAYGTTGLTATHPAQSMVETVLPQQRATIDLNTLGITGSFSTVLTSTIPVAVNRAETFGAGEQSAVLSPAIERPSTGWTFPVGLTGNSSGFMGASEFLLLFNPSQNSAARISISILAANGTIIHPPNIIVQPKQRTTLDLGKLGLPAGRNAVILRGTNQIPFVAEQSVYYANGGAGFSGPGVPAG